jgi:hypothetical protein
MKKLLERWETLCSWSAVLRFVDVNLRGVGQVMFQDNPLSGLLFLIAISWGSFAGGVPQVATGGLLALVAGTLTAYWLRVDRAALQAGLFGFNAYLTGLALPTFLAPSSLLWVYVAFGGAVSVVATLAFMNVFKAWGVAALTAPFVLVAWLMLLASNAFAGLEISALPISGLVSSIDPAAANPLRFGDFVQGVLQSISQVFLKGNGFSALLLILGGGVRGARRGRRRRDRAPARRRERADHRRPAGLQPAADGHRARLRVPPAGTAHLRLRAAGYGVHGHRPGRDEHGADAVRDPDPDRAVRAGDLAVPAAAPAAEVSVEDVFPISDNAR